MHLKVFFVSCFLFATATAARAAQEGASSGATVEQPTESGALLEGTLFDVLVFGGHFSANFVDFFLLGIFLLIAYKLLGIYRKKRAACVYEEDDDPYVAPNEDVSLASDDTLSHTIGPLPTDMPLDEAVPSDDTDVETPYAIDMEEILTYAESSFIRLQASWDRRDLNDIALFTSPHFFEEIQLQYAEDPEPSETDIHIANVRFVDTKILEGEQWIRVYFDVLMRTSSQRNGASSGAMRVREIWYFVRSLEYDDMWQLDHIQAVEE